eukprot:3106743-Ditylum_brightwellii.AAC.3
MKNCTKCYKDNDNNWCCLCQGSRNRDCSSNYNKEELNAIISKRVKAALKKECHRPYSYTKKANTINNFDALYTSSSDNSADGGHT